MYFHIKIGQFLKQVRHKTYKYIVIYAFLCPFYIIANRELWDKWYICLTLTVWEVTAEWPVISFR